jgi:hypothetical protein
MTYIPNQPAEKTGFVTTSNLTNGSSYVSSILDAAGYSQVQTEVNASHDGTMTFEFCSDAGGTDVVRTLTVPYTAANGYQLFGAPAFTNYIRYAFLNNSGSDQTDFYFTTKFLTVPLSPQTLRVDGFISPAMMANINRSVIVGADSSGNFQNSTVTATTNDSGTYYNLNVVSGARPSQLAGRTKVTEVVDTVASVLQRTITTDKTFYVTDILLTIDNSDNASAGRVNLRDGLTVAGTIVLPMQVQEAPTNESAVTVITHTFADPIEFNTGVFIEEGVGINAITGVIIGYEE